MNHRAQHEPSAMGCPFCDGPLGTKIVVESVPYATQSGEVALSAKVPYEYCQACGYEGFGEAGERARTEVVYRHLGRITPWEIVAVRESLGLTQAAFADWLNVGRASLERWERGATMHNQSMDSLILLLSDPSRKDDLDRERYARLRKATAATCVVDLGRFRSLRPRDERDLARRQAAFKLRRQA